MKYYNDGKKVAFENVAEDINTVKLNTAYDHNCSEQDECDVSDKILDVIMTDERKNINSGRTERNHRVNMPTNDCEAAKMGLTLPSAEEVFFEEDEMAEGIKEEGTILEIFSHLTQTQKRRLFLMYNDKLSVAEIAELEGVGEWSIRDSIRIAIEKLRKHGKFLQEAKSKSWTDLLIVDEKSEKT